MRTLTVSSGVRRVRRRGYGNSITAFHMRRNALTLIEALRVRRTRWKTFQARIGARLLLVEKMLREAGARESAPFQLYSAWSAQQKNAAAMFAEYFANAIRPTVAYPYVGLIVLTVGAQMFGSAPF